MGHSTVVTTPAPIPFFSGVVLRDALTAINYIIYMAGMEHWLYAHVYLYGLQIIPRCMDQGCNFSDNLPLVQQVLPQLLPLFFVLS